jgi:hypothetical protein
MSLFTQEELDNISRLNAGDDAYQEALQNGKSVDEAVAARQEYSTPGGSSSDSWDYGDIITPPMASGGGGGGTVGSTTTVVFRPGVSPPPVYGQPLPPIIPGIVPPSAGGMGSMMPMIAIGAVFVLIIGMVKG